MYNTATNDGDLTGPPISSAPPHLHPLLPMPEPDRDLYAASVNPSRRAKRASISATVEPSPSADIPLPAHPRNILPMRPYAPRPSATSSEPAEPPAPPAKRGRKPGPLSKTAREAQRRLNHSIIEKARRTKINDALATLKQLVPPNYGQGKKASEEDDVDDDAEDDEDDDDGEYQGSAKKAKAKPKGKKEEKEKEFKLEILVRTVTFLQDVLQRVDTLEAGAGPAPICRSCGRDLDKKKRARDDEEDVETMPMTASGSTRSAKVPRVDRHHSPQVHAESSRSTPTPLAFSSAQSSANPSPHLRPQSDSGRDRLPSISSWLHNPEIDPQLLPPSQVASSLSSRSFPTPPASTYLPSPPSSTQFDPVRSSQIPPVLNLGPVATAAMLKQGSSSSSKNGLGNGGVHVPRTPEDESAASLLLRIATSPQFRPVSTSPPFRPLSTSSSASGHPSHLPDPSNFSLHSDARSATKEGSRIHQAQTPSSILGLKRH